MVLKSSGKEDQSKLCSNKGCAVLWKKDSAGQDNFYFACNLRSQSILIKRKERRKREDLCGE